MVFRTHAESFRPSRPAAFSTAFRSRFRKRTAIVDLFLVAWDNFGRPRPLAFMSFSSRYDDLNIES
jgi:hypothetical protein